MRAVVRICLIALSASCASTAAPIPPGAMVVLKSGADARVGTYVSKPWGFETASYWIEGPSGLVLIDTQFLPSAAEEAVAWAEQVTGKKVVAAIVLHPNPDKFNGAAVLAARGIEVLTSAQVAALIPSVHESRKKSFYQRYKPDYPEDAPRVASFGDRTTTIDRAGLALTAHVLGPGASGAHVVIEWDGHVFPGDLVTNDGHAWLELGLVEPWIARLDEIAKLEPKRVHPGRGPSGDVGLVAAQRTYLARVAEIVDSLRSTGVEEKAGVEQAIAQVLGAYPGYGLPIFVEIGMRAVWRGRPAAN